VTSAEADLCHEPTSDRSGQPRKAIAGTIAARFSERVKSLVDRQLVSVSDVETARKNVELAESDVLIAQAQLRNAQAGANAQGHPGPGAH
jgi:multidrug resistance efflux pump